MNKNLFPNIQKELTYP